MQELINKAVSAFEVHANADDDTLIGYLASSGLDEATAERLVRFIPIAFGRHLLNDLGIAFPSTFVRFDADGTVTESKQLLEEPVYAAAVEFLKQNTLKRETMSAIVVRSSEVIAINNALHAGSEPANLLLAPPVIFNAPPTETGIRKANAFIRETLQKSESSKPWWKFW